MPTRPTFLYDADCGPCAAFARLAALLDPSHAVDLIPIAEAANDGMLDSVPRPLWFSSSRMIDPSGTISAGADAVVSLLQRLPLGEAPSKLISRSQAASSVGRRLYGAASRLHGTSCPQRTQFAVPPAARSLR